MDDEINFQHWIKSKLTQKVFNTTFGQVSTYCTQFNFNETAVLFHGITGDFRGLVPLSIELNKKYNIVIVEIPGHGDSDMINNADKYIITKWYNEVIVNIELQLGKIDFIIAHSFACALVEKTNNSKIFLINPVIQPSYFYKLSALFLKYTMKYISGLYNSPKFIIFRGNWLSKSKDKQAKNRVKWVELNSHPTNLQLVSQVKLLDVVFSKKFIFVDRAIAICALNDKIPKQRNFKTINKKYPNWEVSFLNGGHLLPIEEPRKVVELIEKYLNIML